MRWIDKLDERAVHDAAVGEYHKICERDGGVFMMPSYGASAFSGERYVLRNTHGVVMAVFDITANDAGFKLWELELTKRRVGYYENI